MLPICLAKGRVLNCCKVKAGGFLKKINTTIFVCLSNCQTVSETIWISPSLSSFLEMG